MRKGLGMWVMSKLVMVIFLFSLVLVLSMFMRVYSDKIISDTAESYTLLWSEVASGSLLYRASGDSVYLPDIIRVREANREYTAVVKKSGDERVVFFLSWQKHDTLDAIQKEGFAAASGINMPEEVSENGKILLFEGSPDEPTFSHVDNALIVKPSLRSYRDSTLAFYRNNSYFCVGTIKDGVPVEQAMNQLGACCQGDWDVLPECY